MVKNYEATRRSNIMYSIIIPVYNRSELLISAVNSVIAQTFSDWELLICDDASTENIERVVEEFNDPRVKYFRNEVNGGNAVARNLGVRNSSGHYVCFLDSDDTYHVDFLERMRQLIFANKQPGFLWCGVNRINVKGVISNPLRVYPWYPEKADDPYAYFLQGIYFGTDCGFTVRRDCFVKVGYFDDRLRVAVDTDFILRIVMHCNFAYSRDIWLDTRDHEGERVRKNVPEKARSYALILEKHRARIMAKRELTIRWFYKLMWLSYHSGDKKQARTCLAHLARGLHWKSIGLALIFESLPLKSAVRIHRRIAGFS